MLYPQYQKVFMLQDLSGVVTGSDVASKLSNTLVTAPLDQNILVIVNGEGGSAATAMHLHELIHHRNLKGGRVDTLITSQALSAHSVVFSAGKERYMAEDALWGMHYGAGPMPELEDNLQSVRTTLHLNEQLLLTSLRQAFRHHTEKEPVMDLIQTAGAWCVYAAPAAVNLGIATHVGHPTLGDK